MNKTILLINTALLILILLYLGITYKKDKQAYVNIGELYDSFDMKKELENKLISVQNQRKKVLDSLEVELQLISNKYSNEEAPIEIKQEFNLLKGRFITQREQFSKENERVTLEFKNQIFTQINNYVAEYAKEHKYDYLFGTTGQGSIMYAEEENNITKEVANYINERYKGNS